MTDVNTTQVYIPKLHITFKYNNIHNKKAFEAFTHLAEKLIEIKPTIKLDEQYSLLGVTIDIEHNPTYKLDDVYPVVSDQLYQIATGVQRAWDLTYAEGINTLEDLQNDGYNP